MADRTFPAGVIDSGLMRKKVGRTLGGNGNFKGGLKSLDRPNAPNVLTNNPEFFNKADLPPPLNSGVL